MPCEDSRTRQEEFRLFLPWGRTQSRKSHRRVTLPRPRLPTPFYEGISFPRHRMSPSVLERHPTVCFRSMMTSTRDRPCFTPIEFLRLQPAGWLLSIPLFFCASPHFLMALMILNYLQQLKGCHAVLPKDGSQTVMQRGVDMPRAVPPPQSPCAGEQDPLPKFENSVSPSFTLITTFRRHISGMTIQRHLKGLATNLPSPAVQRWAVPLPACPGELLSFQSSKETICQGRRQRINPWRRKIPWRRKWPPTPVFLPRKSQIEETGRLQSMGLQRVRHN